MKKTEESNQVPDINKNMKQEEALSENNLNIMVSEEVKSETGKENETTFDEETTEKETDEIAISNEISSVLTETKEESTEKTEDDEGSLRLLSELHTQQQEEANEEDISEEAADTLIPDNAGKEGNIENEEDTIEFNEEDYIGLPTEQLTGIYEELVSREYKAEEKNIISTLKLMLTKRFKEEKLGSLAKFIEEGGIEKDFDAPDNPIEERFKTATQLYREKRAVSIQEQEEQKQKNLETKLKMLDKLKDLVASDEPLKKTYDEFNVLQEKWKEIGPVPRNEANTLWQNYHHYVEKFFEKVKINKELRDLDLRKNLETKIAICEKVEALLIESSITKSFKLLQKYHDEWKDTGAVPSDRKDDIWERFRAATDKINERRKEHYSNVNEQQQKNYEAKLAICEKTEELISGEIKSTKEYQDKTSEINEMMNLWKTLGTAPKKQNDEIWERFRASINSFFDNKKEFFEQLKDQQTENYNKKVQLCLQAEALKTGNEWKKTSLDLIRLQKEWKEIGPAPRKQADKLWKRFRSACDEFFNRKSEYFANLEGSEKENLRLKLELIKRIEDYQFGENRAENLDVLKGFQREWMNISHVPLKNKNQVQDAFRAAINKHLDKLKISSVEITTMEFKNRMDNLKNVPGSDRIIGKEKFNLQTKLAKIKNDISLWENNIGFLANSRNADLLRDEFQKKIDQAKQDALIIETKIKLLAKEGR